MDHPPRPPEHVILRADAVDAHCTADAEWPGWLQREAERQSGQRGPRITSAAEAELYYIVYVSNLAQLSAHLFTPCVKIW